MNKFKVGDKVRFIKQEIDHNNDVILGKVYTIKGVDSDGDYRVTECGDYFEESELSHAVATKAHLKSHHIVENRLGSKDVWEEEDADDYNDDMEYYSMGDRDKDYDIMKVYEFETLVWERETKASEMTVAEIEEALGKKIKIIKGGE